MIRRFRRLAALSAIACLAFAGVAVALTKPMRVTGGTGSVTLSAAAVNVLTQNHITIKPLGRATASGATATFPAVGGRLNTKLRGYITYAGGVALSNGTKTVELRRPTLYNKAGGTSIYALLAKRTTGSCTGHPRRHRIKCKVVTRYTAARVAKITGGTVSGNTASGTLELTAASAQIVNRLAGHQIVKAGEAFATGTTTPTLS